MAAADGTSRWITSAESRADVHRLRAECDAIVAGVGTVLADDPHLTVRDADGAPGRRRSRCGSSSTPHGRTPPGARVLDDAAPTWVATAAELGTDADGGSTCAALLEALRARGRRLVLLEGGPTLAGAFLRAGLVDRVVAYLAPSAARRRARRRSAGAGVATLADGVRLDDRPTSRGPGPDVRVTARPADRGGSA